MSDRSDDPILLWLFLVLLLIVAVPVGRRLVAEARERAEEARRRAAEEAARRAAFEAERDELLARPIPPDIARDMRGFDASAFADPSPLAYAGYRVGKTNGLPERQRRERLEVCFRLTIPPELPAKYQSWGAPLTYRRYAAMLAHLGMLADQRRDRPNYEVAVAHWDADRSWLHGRFNDFADRLSKYGRRG